MLARRPVIFSEDLDQNCYEILYFGDSSGGGGSQTPNPPLDPHEHEQRQLPYVHFIEKQLFTVDY